MKRKVWYDDIRLDSKHDGDIEGSVSGNESDHTINSIYVLERTGSETEPETKTRLM
ncbi:MAG: hypothetical protein ACI4EA_03615 [Candidatus Ornithomonoglobus sp.]